MNADSPTDDGDTVPFDSLDAAMTLWLPLAIGVLASLSGARRQTKRRREGPPIQLAFKPKRALLLAAPLAWQPLAHGSDNLGGRLFAVVMVMGVGILAGTVVLALVSTVARLIARD